jgi:transposase
MVSGLGNRQFYLYIESTDMRKSFNGLTGLVTNELKRDPSLGDAFIFVNKRRDKLKLLVWDDSGYLIYYKQLESGTFEIPIYRKGIKSLSIDRSELVMILEGIQLKSVRHRKRYKSPVAS